MKNLPERIFVHKLSRTLSDKEAEVRLSDDDVEFIRKDVAESELIKTILEFADWYDRQSNPPESQNEKWMNESNAKSFLTSRNKS